MKAKILYNRRIYDNVDREKYYDLKTGDIVEVNIDIKANAEDVLNELSGMCYLCKHRGQYNYIPATCLDIDFSEKDIDWEERRYEIAKSALNGLLSSNQSADISSGESCNGQIIGSALYYAEELIRRLKMK